MKQENREGWEERKWKVVNGEESKEGRHMDKRKKYGQPLT